MPVNTSAWYSDWLSCSSRNIAFHWWRRVPSLLPILLHWGEVAWPRQQALGEETHHSGGGRTLNSYNTQTVLCSHRPFFVLHITLIKLEWSSPQNCSLKGAVVSITLLEAILPQYWLTAWREWSLCMYALTFDPSGINERNLYRGLHAEEWKAYTKSSQKKPAWHVSSLMRFWSSSNSLSGSCRCICLQLSDCSVSGGPDFNGVTEEYGCCRRRLLPAVCRAAAVPGRDDGVVLKHFFFFFDLFLCFFGWVWWWRGLILTIDMNFQKQYIELAGAV